MAIDQIVKRGGAAVRDTLAHHIRFAVCNAAARLFQRDIRAFPIVFIRTLFVPCGLAALLYLLFGAKAVVRPAPFHQLVGVFLVDLAPLALDIRAIGAAYVRPLVIGKAGLLHRPVDQIGCALHIALLVGILHAQNKLAAVVFCKQPTVQRRSQPADVQIARRAGRKPCAYLAHIHSPFVCSAVHLACAMARPAMVLASGRAPRIAC